MKIKEVTNPEEQLGLLRVIIDNTWSAIKQQADAQARQKEAQPANKSKAKSPKATKLAPYAAMPKQLPKPKALYQSKPQDNSQPISNPKNSKSFKASRPSIGTQSPTVKAMPTPLNPSLTNYEKDEVINLPRGALPKTL
jgi:hypothetical protein